MVGKTINLAKQFRIQAKNGRIIIAIILYKGTATIQHIKRTDPSRILDHKMCIKPGG